MVLGGAIAPGRRSTPARQCVKREEHSDPPGENDGCDDVTDDAEDCEARLRDTLYPVRKL